MKIINFCGQLASGKDTCADFLAGVLNSKCSNEWPRTQEKPWQRVAFANAVKDVFCQAFKEDRAFIEEWKRKDEVPEGFLKPVRQSLQFIGDGFREIRSTIWVELALDTEDPIILSDGRYINELKTVTEKGGMNVLVWRPGFENDDPNGSEAQLRPLVDWCNATDQVSGKIDLSRSAHNCCVPEGIQYVDILLKNDSDLEDLYRKVNDHVVPFVEDKFGI